MPVYAVCFYLIKSAPNVTRLHLRDSNISNFFPGDPGPPPGERFNPLSRWAPAAPMAPPAETLTSTGSSTGWGICTQCQRSHPHCSAASVLTPWFGEAVNPELPAWGYTLLSTPRLTYVKRSLLDRREINRTDTVAHLSTARPAPSDRCLHAESCYWKVQTQGRFNSLGQGYVIRSRCVQLRALSSSLWSTLRTPWSNCYRTATASDLLWSRRNVTGGALFKPIRIWPITDTVLNCSLTASDVFDDGAD